MTEQPDDPTLEVARDLRAIVELSGLLHDQAAHRASHHEMPGGDATVMLGPVASPEAWENRVETVERLWWEDDETFPNDVKHRPNPVVDEDANWEPPLMTLLFWSEAWRWEHNSVIDARPTTASEAGWLGGILQWAYDHEPRWEDFAKDVAAARRRLEAVLYAGEREERSRVPCLYCVEDSAGSSITVRLVKRFGSKIEHDYWFCPKCRREYNRDAFAQAKASHLGSAPADRYVLLHVALAAIPRPPTTVRSWLYRTKVKTERFTGRQRVSERGRVKWACDVRTRSMLVWWPHVRDMHAEKTARETERRAG